jgi:copper chaperone CopZ
MDEQTYTVVGMTCDHCALSVREEVSELVGVETVEVDMPSGRLAVNGRDVSSSAVQAAVEAAGYAIL